MPDETNYSPRDAPPGDQEKTGSLIAFPRARLPKKRPPDNLPLQLTSFIGREMEVARVERLLVGGTRLVTLCGPGGCGKTRLALAVAQEMVEGFEDGVWWVELASLSEPDLVPGALASALGVREVADRSLTEALIEHLKPRETLLVLDNCEHLVEGCATLVDTLLRACPKLEILATSREPLRIAGETIGVVPSLSLPDPGRLPPAGELGRYEAVRLFVERAKAVDSGFALTGRNAAAVVRLCRKLDGIPLAIELAAARVRALTVEQILEKLEDPLGLLTTGSRAAAPRHQTLRATLQWSYELLSEQERELLGRLSVFAGGWDLEAAEAVGAKEPVEAGRVLDLLSTLVDKSLVVAEKSGEEGFSVLRYGMLEPVRQFGREKLQEGSEAPEVLRRHAEHYLALAEAAEPELLGADQGRWLRRLRTEFGNLRGASSWSVKSEQEGERAELRLRLVAALCQFWGREGFEEGKRWLRTALERDPGGFPAARAKALGGLGFILLFQQDYEPAIAALEEAIALYKELGDESGAALALANLGYVVLHGGYRERVPAFVREAETLMREGDLDSHAHAYLRTILGCAAQGAGDFDSAASQLEEALALFRELGSLREAGMSLFILGNVEIDRGDLDRGVTLLKEGARIARELGDMLGTAYYVWGLGRVAVLHGKPARAARQWGAAEALREQMGMSLSHFDLAASGYEQDLAAVRSTLSEATFDAAWTEGRAMSPEQAIEYALEAVGEPAADTPTVAPVVAPEPTPSAQKPAKTAEAKATTTAGLRVFALGPARVEKDGLPLDSSPDWIQKPRELLYYLLCHPEGRTKEQIGLALWPDASTAQLRSSFHDTVYRLRRTLEGKEWVAFHKGRYAFNRSLAYSFDVEDFEEHLSEARRVQAQAPEQSIRHLQQAARLYGGDFLEDSADSEWAMIRREEIEREYGEALLLLGGLLFAQERPAEAGEAYRMVITHDGYLEEAHRGLMRCQAAMGDRSRALRHYEELVGLLEEQLGTSPAPETKALHERLRAGEEV
jgi:predicted ATPase/DNA-binding SARP family transcriptional activator/predicted RNase H-like HicB family nuclease